VDVIDLFAGMGGLAIGFAQEKFEVKGFDINPVTCKIFQINSIGEAETVDLSRKIVSEKAEILIGGPPCRPWSSINVTRRGCEHPDYGLIDVFFIHVLEIKPTVFIMENVPPLLKDEKFKWWIEILKYAGYSVDSKKIVYSDFGAPTSRKRLFVAGFNNGYSAKDFFDRLEEYKTDPKTVMDAIQPFISLKKHEFPDHEWPELKTIKKYEKYYKTGKYGWYRLDPHKPSPSFGNIMKTYILHPFAGNGVHPRVISVREAMSIMGFDADFRFPEKVGMSIKYQMVADAVSPVFSRVCAKVIREMLK